MHEHLTAAEIERGLLETNAVLTIERQCIESLVKGKGLPRDPLARSQLLESHHKFVEKLENDMEDLLAERAKR
jgi:hypothetical protein